MLPDQLEKAEQTASKFPMKQEVRKKSCNTFPFKSKQTSKPRFLLLTTHMLPGSGSSEMTGDKYNVVKKNPKNKTPTKTQKTFSARHFIADGPAFSS